jgi:hypothetical protein
MTPKDKKLLTYLQETFDEAKRLTEGSRKEGRDAYEYMRGNQLPDDVKGELEDRGQPARWENIYMKIDNKVEGMKMMTREEISVLPRSVDKKEQFITITNVLRASQDATEWKTHKKRADRDLRVVGISAVEEQLCVLDEVDAQGKRLKEIRRVHLPALECLPDMYASNPDMSDSRYFHHTRLVYKGALVKLFKAKAEKLPENDDKMVRVNRTWYRDPKTGAIRVAVWEYNTLLEDKVSPFNKLDRFPIAIRRLRWSHKKEYYGMYRDVRPFQDSVNFTMLRLINMLGSSKLLVESDAVEDIDTFKDEYTMDNSVTEVRAGSLKDKKIHDISHTTNVSQLMNIVQDARLQAEMVIGLNSEVLGSAVNRLSGYAIESRQNAGLVGLQNYMDVSGELDIDLAQIDLKIMEEHFTAEQIFYIDGKNGKERESVVLNPYERDEGGRMVYNNGAPAQKSIMSLGRYDVSFRRVPFNRGATAERQKNWTEVLKSLPEEDRMAMIPSMLRDIESPEAEEAQRIIEQRSAQSEQNNDAMQAQMQQMQQQMKDMESKIRERDSKTLLNTAKAKEIEADLVNEGQ